MTGVSTDSWYSAAPMTTLASAPAPALASPHGEAANADAARRFATLFDVHHRAMWRTLRRLGVADADVDDAVQKLFLVVARRLPELRVGEEGRFLYGVALRVASETRRRSPTLRRTTEDDQILAALADDAPGPEEQLLEHEARTALDHALAAMPDDLREVLVLVELEGVAVPILADLLGVPVGTAASRLRRARAAFTESARRVRARMNGGAR